MSDGNSSGNTGLVLGLMAGAGIGYVRFGPKGLVLGIVGAIIGAMAETSLTAGREGRSSLLLSLVPVSFFAVIAYLVWRYFR